MCVCTPAPPTLLQTHRHAAVEMLAIITALCFIKTSNSAFLPPADECVSADILLFHYFWLLFLAKHQTSGKAVLLKCQLKMKINNSEAGRKGDTANISPHPRTGLALPPGAGWRLTGGEAGSGSRGGVPSV